MLRYRQSSDTSGTPILIDFLPKISIITSLSCIHLKIPTAWLKGKEKKTHIAPRNSFNWFASYIGISYISHFTDNMYCKFIMI